MALPPQGVLQIRSGDGEHVIAIHRPLLIAYFSRPPKEAELGVLRGLIDEAVAEGVSGGTLFVIARRDMRGGIQPHVRQFFEKMVKENSGRFGASAAVVLTEGFGGSLMRSFLTGLLLLMNKRNKLQIFGSVEAACRWLAPLHQLEAAALLEVYAKATAGVQR